MSSSVLQRLRQTGFGWLLGWLLVLPLAQSAAAWHEVSHLGSAARTTQTQREEASLADNGVCALCLAAAAVDAGGMPAALLPFVGPELGHALGPAAVVAVWLAAAFADYRSRAPPRSLS